MKETILQSVKQDTQILPFVLSRIQTLFCHAMHSHAFAFMWSYVCIYASLHGAREQTARKGDTQRSSELKKKRDPICRAMAGTTFTRGSGIGWEIGACITFPFRYIFCPTPNFFLQCVLLLAYAHGIVSHFQLLLLVIGSSVFALLSQSKLSQKPHAQFTNRSSDLD